MALHFSNCITPTVLRGLHPPRIVYFKFMFAAVSETKESDVTDHCRQFKLLRKREYLQRAPPHSFMWYGGLSKANTGISSCQTFLILCTIFLFSEAVKTLEEISLFPALFFLHEATLVKFLLVFSIA